MEKELVSVDPKQLKKDILFLNRNRATKHKTLPRRGQCSYNCWGFTRGLLESSGYFWEYDYDMEDWLKEKTKLVTGEKHVGDILVFRGINYDECCCANEDVCDCEVELLHTAILVDPDNMIVIHKPGEYRLERCTVEFILTSGDYCYGEVIETRRYVTK